MAKKRQQKKARQKQRKQNEMRAKAGELADSPMADSIAEESENPEIENFLEDFAPEEKKSVGGGTGGGISYEQFEAGAIDPEWDDDLWQPPDEEPRPRKEVKTPVSKVKSGEPEIVEEKFYGGSSTSFEELDKERTERKKIHEAQSISYDAEMLIHNVIHSDMAMAKKSSAITKVGKDMASKISALMADRKELDEDINALMAKSILTNIDKTLAQKIKEKLGLSNDVRDFEDEVNEYISLVEKGEIEPDERLTEIIKSARELDLIPYPSQKYDNSIVVEKDASGDYRWVGWVSNNFKDRDKDIIVEDAHKEYVGWLDENPDLAPEFLTWHTAGTGRKSKADFWMFDKGFLIMSGKLTKGEAHALLKTSSKTKIGMSHGFFPISVDKGKNKSLIEKYRTFEVSDLPLDKAANPWTDFETVLKEVGMNKEQYLSEILGEEKASAFLARTSEKQEALREAGVEEKETSQEDVVEEIQEESVKEVETDEFKKLIKQVGEEYGLPELSAWVEKANVALELVPQLVELISSEEKAETDRIAEQFEPKVKKQFAWTENRASQDKETIVTDKKEIEKATPKTGWLSEASGTDPLPMEDIQ